MLSALKLFLEKQGYKNIYCDYMPDTNNQLQAINITCWNHTVADICDGTGVRYIQIQCRDTDYAAAYNICHSIFTLLDSGVDEKIINLTDDVFCIARPRRGPTIYERGNNYTTFYFETALWGTN
jgi:hypothetical protein